jgi:DNA-binding FadR family transcriptional regulator
MTVRHDQVVRSFIMDGVRSGTFAPGDKLPTERVLSNRLGVSRSAVRDALAVLESAGLVARIVGSGTYVRDIGPLGPADHGGSASSPSEIMEARLLLEPRLAILAAANADSGDLARLDECVRAGEEVGDFEDFEHWDAKLHQAIADATHNRLVIELYATITRARDQMEWGEMKRRSITAERRNIYRREHREIVTALRERDARRAEAALTAHVKTVRTNLLGV